MRNKTTIILLAAVLLVGGYILVLDYGKPSRPDRDERQKLAFPDLKDGETDFIRFEWEKRVLAFRKDGLDWTMTEPANVQADQSALDRIVDKLLRLERGERITRKQRDESSLDVAHFGFIPPRGRLIIGDRGNPMTYLLGRDAPLGEDFYIKKENDEDILRVSRIVLDLLNTDLENLLDRTIFHAEPDQISRIELRRRGGGFLQMQRGESGQWRLLQPFPGRADQGEAAELVSSLLNARVEKFEEGAVVDSALYGLDDPRILVTLSTRDSEDPQSFRLGSTHPEDPKLVYGLMEGADSLLAVSTGLVAKLSVETDDLLDRRLITFQAEEIQKIRFRYKGDLLEAEPSEAGSWQIVSPVKWKANPEQFETFLKAWTSASIEGFLPEAVAGATNQAPLEAEWTIEFVRKGTTENPEVTTIDVYPVTSTNGQVEVQVQGEAVSSLVSEELMAPVSINPLAWKDREVLALSRADIVRVAMARADTESVVQKIEDGSFSAVGDDKAVVNKPALEGLLDRVASLKVWAYLLEAEPNPEELGLMNPERVVTFGLRGDVGISKSILLGAVGPAGGRYAQIRGQDVVFLLDEETVEQLMQDVWLTPTEPNEEAIEPKG